MQISHRIVILAATAKSVWIAGIYFEKQSMTTDPATGVHAKFKDNLALYVAKGSSHPDRRLTPSSWQ